MNPRGRNSLKKNKEGVDPQGGLTRKEVHARLRGHVLHMAVGEGNRWREKTVVPQKKGGSKGAAKRTIFSGIAKVVMAVSE